MINLLFLLSIFCPKMYSLIQGKSIRGHRLRRYEDIPLVALGENENTPLLAHFSFCLELRWVEDVQITTLYNEREANSSLPSDVGQVTMNRCS